MTKSNSLALSRAKKKVEKLLKKNQLPEARVALQELCQLAPGDHTAWLNLGAVSAQLGDRQTAEQAWRQALAVRGDLAQAHRNLAQLYSSVGRWPEAETHFRAYLSSNPKDTEALSKLGLILEGMGKLAEAEEIYCAELQYAPKSATASLGLGRVLRNLGREKEAIELIDQALGLQPNLAMAYLERAQLSRIAKNYAEALGDLQKFHQLAPREKETYLLNCADIHTEQEQYEQALDFYDQAVKAFPRSAYSHWGRSLILLELGRYKEGWAEFEWRKQYPDWQKQVPGFCALKPQWQGQDLAGKKILVFAEQGFGDTIQFSRYLPKLASKGAEVTFHCQPELASLLSGLEGVTVVERDIQQAAGFDYYLPVMSLPAYLDAELEEASAQIPYIHSDRERLEKWRERLAGDGFKVGLVWGGSVLNPLNRRKSFDLQTFEPLKAIPDVTFYSLQKGLPETAKQGPQWQGVVDLDGEIKDFADTAAAIANLDLVITVDTAVAHLALAMGHPTWVLIFSGSDWRWHAGDKNIWYPQARLFRQAVGESWESVVERVVDALKSTSV